MQVEKILKINKRAGPNKLVQEEFFLPKKINVPELLFGTQGYAEFFRYRKLKTLARGKSLLESRGTTFLPDWQHP